MESSHAKEIPENLQVLILIKGLKPTLLTLVMPKNPQTLEQKTNARASRSVNSADSSLQNEIMCLRNQLSEVLAIQKQNSEHQPQSHWSHQGNMLNSPGKKTTPTMGTLPPVATTSTLWKSAATTQTMAKYSA